MTQPASAMASAGSAAVLYDPKSPWCRVVASRLRASFWIPSGDAVPQSMRLVVVVDSPLKGHAAFSLIEKGIRPALLVAVDLSEESVARFLDQKIPVVDGALLYDEKVFQDALDAIGGRWSPDRFVREADLARLLERLEHLVTLP